MYDLYGKCNDLNVTPFNYTELKNDYDADIDPDNNFCNNLCINSQYYADSQFDSLSESKTNWFSVVHFNCRSMSANFDKIREYIHNRKIAFSVIALSEVWLSEDQVNFYQLEGYDNYC